jgi:membrane protein
VAWVQLAAKAPHKLSTRAGAGSSGASSTGSGPSVASPEREGEMVVVCPSAQGRATMDRTDGEERERTRGRQAAHPAQFPARSWRRILYRIWIGIGRDHLSIIAAGVAFFCMLAFFPAIAALIALYGLLADPAQIGQTLQVLQPVLPHDVFEMLKGQIDQLTSAGRTRLGIASLISIGLTLWTSRAGVSALTEGLNVVYRETDTRNIIIQYLMSLVLTVAAMVVAIIALLAVVALPALLHFSDLGPAGRILAQVLPLSVLGFASVFAIGGLYRYGPHRARARKRWLSPGALIATAGWVAVSLALSIYVARFADFNKTYGSIGAIVGLMFWLYATAFVVLLGAELNAEMELETEKDTTTGRARPMGERGAYVADHVA